MKLAIFLMGPTAVGKSHLAFDLAQHLPIEIISVDSAMVYRGMDIGTAKPSAEVLKSIPHHLIDIRDPQDAYSAAAFVEDALLCMQGIVNRGKIPLLVGGTSFYFRALMQGLSPLPSADPQVRAALSRDAAIVGWEAMHQRLESIDPIAAKRIHPHDGQRIQRALEIYALSKTSLSSLCETKPASLEGYGTLSFARMQPDRALLHQLIAKRFHSMLIDGLIQEVEVLCKQGLSPQMPAMRAVGYRQIRAYLEGETNYQTMVDSAIAATRQLAKRQISWIKHAPSIIHLENTHLASLKTMLDCVEHYYGENKDV